MCPGTEIRIGIGFGALQAVFASEELGRDSERNQHSYCTELYTLTWPPINTPHPFTSFLSLFPSLSSPVSRLWPLLWSSLVFIWKKQDILSIPLLSHRLFSQKHSVLPPPELFCLSSMHFCLTCFPISVHLPPPPPPPLIPSSICFLTAIHVCNTYSSTVFGSTD